MSTTQHKQYDVVKTLEILVCLSFRHTPKKKILSWFLCVIPLLLLANLSSVKYISKQWLFSFALF